MTIRYLTYYLLIVFTVQSCIYREFDVDIPEIGNKMVINSIINPDSLFKINLSKTYSSLETDYLQFIFLDSAKVSIYENDRLIEDLIYTGEGVYTSTYLKPKELFNYKIEINNIDGCTASSEIDVPK